MGRQAKADTDVAAGLHFLPLGGSGEIGMNLNLYACDGTWLMVDLGVTFGDDSVPGIDLILPDPAFIEARRDQLAGLVLTHAHEDHLGAVPYLWPRLQCPVYATPFAAAVLRRKLREAGMLSRVSVTEIPLGGRFEIGPFDLELITLTHSIPEPNAVAIRTSYGTVLHTGDWKIDPQPLVGEVTDETALRRLGNEGVLAMVCDSTNAMREGHSGSEGEVRRALVDLVGRCDGRIAVGCFASNVARLETLHAAATAHGRHAALVGRSLWRMYEAAQETGYLRDVQFISESDAGYLPREAVLLICTGSQGEPRSALSRIASDTHPHIALERGDTVIFSSRIIPGNEKSIGVLQDKLVRLGIDIVTERDHFVHVSGHPARDELMTMYRWVRPRISIPVHGELRHMQAHAELARNCQVPQQIVVENGALVHLAPGQPGIVERVPSGRLVADGPRILPFDGAVMRGRRRAQFQGTAVVTLVIDAAGRLVSEPRLAMPGTLDPESAADLAILDAAVAAVRRAVESLPPAARRADEAVEEAARRAVRKVAAGQLGKKPVTEVHLVRL